jgi:hypothetical protein
VGALQGVLAGLGIGALVSDFLDATSKLSDLSAKTAISVRELQRLQYAGELVGVSLDQISSAVSMMQNRLAGGNKGAVAAVQALNINLDQLRQLEPGQQFEVIAREIARIPDPAERTNRAMEIFGRSGAQLLPLLTSDMRALGDEAERLGAVMSGDVIAAGDRLGDLWTKLGLIGRNLVAQGLKPLLDTMRQMSDPGELARWEQFKDALGVNALVRQWKLLKVAMDGVGATPKLPGAPGLFGADTLPTSTLTDEEARRIEEQLTAGITGGRGGATRVNPYSGQDLFAAAKQAMQDIAAVGGLTKLTADEQRRLNDELGRAIEKYAALGKTAPKAMTDLWIATLGPGVGPLTSMPGTNVGIPEIPIFPVPSLGVTNGLPGMPGTNVGMPQIPQGPSFWEKSFGSAEEFGTSAAQAILRGLSGGLSGVGSSLGSMMGQSLGTTLAESLTKDMGGLMKGLLGTLIPGLGALVGSLLGPLLDKVANLFDRNKGRDSVLDFAADFGGLDGFQKHLEQLVASGRLATEEAHRLWVMLTQGVGRNNPEQAKAAIEEINRVLGGLPAAPLSMADQAGAAGFETQADLQAKAEQAVKLWQYMRDSGLYSAQQVQLAWERANDALIASGDQQALAAQTATTAVDALSAKIQSLQDSIANEAPEEVMGVVEAQARAQIAALEAERAAAQANLESLSVQSTDTMAAHAQAAGTAMLGLQPIAEQVAAGIQTAFSQIRIHIPVEFDVDQGLGLTKDAVVTEAPEELFANITGMATGGYVPGRSGGTIVRLGEGGEGEYVIPESHLMPAGGGSSRPLHLSIDGDVFARIVTPLITGEAQRLGVS